MIQSPLKQKGATFTGRQVPIFSSQHTPIFPIFKQIPPIFPIF